MALGPVVPRYVVAVAPSASGSRGARLFSDAHDWMSVPSTVKWFSLAKSSAWAPETFSMNRERFAEHDLGGRGIQTAADGPPEAVAGDPDGRLRAD